MIIVALSQSADKRNTDIITKAKARPSASDPHRFVGVPPYLLTPSNLSRAVIKKCNRVNATPLLKLMLIDFTITKCNG